MSLCCLKLPFSPTMSGRLAGSSYELPLCDCGRRSQQSLRVHSSGLCTNTLSAGVCTTMTQKGCQSQGFFCRRKKFQLKMGTNHVPCTLAFTSDSSKGAWLIKSEGAEWDYPSIQSGWESAH